MPLVKPFRGIQLNKSHPLARGLVGCWLMNEGGGNRIYDLSGNGKTGIFYGDTKWVPGRFGYCLSFDGSGDYVDCGDINVDENVPGLTVSMWCKYTSSSLPALDQYFGTRNVTSGNRVWFLRRETDNEITFRVYNTAGAIGTGTALAAESIRDTNWHHVVGVYNGSKVLVYVDTKLGTASQGSLTGNTFSGVTMSLSIGAFNLASNYFDGSIDHVMIFDRGLTAAEIAQLYREPFCVFDRGINPALLYVIIGEDYLRTIDDSLEVIDVTSRIGVFSRDFSESMGVVDIDSRVAESLRILVESLGITDIPGKDEGKSFLDSVGVIDAISCLSVFLKVITDTLGITDEQLVTWVVIRSISDSLDLPDIVSKDESKSIVDSLGLTDLLLLVKGFDRAFSDNVELTDSTIKVYVVLRSISDALDLTDSITRIWAQVRIVSDELGITDEMIGEFAPAGIVRTIYDSLGVTDETSKLYMVLRTLSENLGLTDAIAKVFIVSRLISDTEGITDEMFPGQFVVLTDSIGITDDVTRLVNFLKKPSDNVGIVDSIVRIATTLRTVDDEISITDRMKLISLIQAAWAFMVIRQTRS